MREGDPERGRRGTSPTGDRPPREAPSPRPSPRAPLTPPHPTVTARREGEQFEALGQLLYWFIPIVAAIAVVVGGFASQTYNDGADNFLQAATSDEAPALIVPAEAVLKELQ